MITLYLVCFALGLCLTLLSALGAFTHLHVGHVHVHLAHAAHPQLQTPGAQGGVKPGVSPVNGFTLAAFLCWFGGCGYLLARSHDFTMWIVLALAAVTGLAGGAILFWFLMRVLLPHEHELTADETSIIGALGLVAAPIRDHGTGEIQFSQNGARRFAAARSDAAAALPRGTEVVVMRYEQGIAYVRPWEEVSGQLSPAGSSLSTSASAPTSTHSSNGPDGKDQAL